MLSLKNLKVSEKARIENIQAEGIAKKRLMDMGLIKGTEVKVIGIAPLGDPIEISVRGYNLSIRKKEAESIFISTI